MREKEREREREREPVVRVIMYMTERKETLMKRKCKSIRGVANKSKIASAWWIKQVLRKATVGNFVLFRGKASRPSYATTTLRFCFFARIIVFSPYHVVIHSFHGEMKGKDEKRREAEEVDDRYGFQSSPL